MNSKLMVALVGVAFSATVIGATKVQFAAEDFAAYEVDGKASLDGEAFGKTEGGEVKTCAGEKVLLAPNTDYDVQVITGWQFLRTDRALQLAGPAAKYWKETDCDSQGKFTFDDLPAGKWIIITTVKFLNQGGLVAKKVTTTDNKKAKVIISNANGNWNYFSSTKWIDNS